MNVCLWFHLLKVSRRFDAEISNEWVWNQNENDLTIWMHLARSHSIKKWIMIINIDYLNDEVSSMLVIEHFRSIHSYVDYIQRSKSKMKVFRRKWLISTFLFDDLFLCTRSFSFDQWYERWSWIARYWDLLRSYKKCSRRQWFYRISSSSSFACLNLFVWLQQHEWLLTRLKNYCLSWSCHRLQYSSISRL